ncbi:MAG: prenyltransferase/squalene oxidase repeat-containing protein [Planctomycetota bacterium]
MASEHPAAGPNSKWRTEGVAPPKAASPKLEGKKPPKEPARKSRRPKNELAASAEIQSVDVSEEQQSSKILRGPAWLLSIIAHLVLLILLATLTYRLRGNDGIAIKGATEESSGDPSVEITVVKPEAFASETSNSENEQQAKKIAITSNLPTLAAPSISVNPSNTSDIAGELLSGGGSNSSRTFYLGGGSMASRLPEARIANGRRFGATKESEEAVERALRWLALHQRSDGSWSFDLSLEPCSGRCRHGKPANEDTPTPSTAATGLALLAFLGAGYTQHEGPYQETVSKGIYYLKAVAAETQFGYDWQQGGSMYGHGIAMLALTEAMLMSKLQGEYDTDLKRYVQSGALFTTVAQHDSGSWGYIPGSPGDTTITGWQVLSLLGAEKSGIQMQSGVFKRVLSFLDSVREGSNFEFGYRSPEPEPTTTAIALYLLLHLRNQSGMTYFDRAFDRIADEGPTLTNVYHDYYATMALHHIRHRDWDAWNTTLRDHLVTTQAREGHEAGSWHFRDRWGDVGGRVYTTAMCTLTLEVYYRYLPLYELPEEFPLE